MGYDFFTSVSNFPEKDFDERFKDEIDRAGGVIIPNSVVRHDGKISFCILYKMDINTESLLYSWIKQKAAV